MKYNVDDIDFTSISAKEFENLCYDLLVNYNFKNLIWREGGADNGRDIEANLIFNNAIQNTNTKWFFECKHYTSGGVPPSELHSKIAWADAEKPDYVTFFISSYLTNNAREWLDKIIPQKEYKILIIEGHDFKRRLLQYSDLIERYFSSTKYEDLFKSVRDYKTKFNINPSFEFLKEIIQNIDLSKLDVDDFGFIILNFYAQFTHFETRNETYGDFDEDVIYGVLDYLKDSVSNEILNSFDEYKDNYNTLVGYGILDEMYWIDDYPSDYKIKKYNFQYYVLHLNPDMDQDKWKTGEYLFIKYKDVAFEIFKVENTQIRIIKNFDDNFENTVLTLDSDFDSQYKKYLDISK